MTREALNKLNDQQQHYCETLSILIAREKESKRECSLSHDVGKLRGYLECLQSVGIITNSELRALFLWFSSENREK